MNAPPTLNHHYDKIGLTNLKIPCNLQSLRIHPLDHMDPLLHNASHHFIPVLPVVDTLAGAQFVAVGMHNRVIVPSPAENSFFDIPTLYPIKISCVVFL
ncbi:MAG: hypothetical protein WC222_11215 [Parachlamydiales bacterium]